MSHPGGDAAEPEVNDRRGEEGQNLADEKSANDADAERLAKFGTDAAAEGERDRAEERGHGGHHDGAEAQQARLIDGLFGRLAFLTFRFEGEVDHHDGVLLDDTDQKNDAYKSNDIEIFLKQNQGGDGADTGGRKRRENRDGVDVAFVQNAQYDVD